MYADCHLDVVLCRHDDRIERGVIKMKVNFINNVAVYDIGYESANTGKTRSFHLEPPKGLLHFVQRKGSAKSQDICF
jgi:hypothetical protein